MKVNTLKNPQINQNGYHKNVLTKERIGTLFIYPIDFTPDDCLSCEGYSLQISDYEDLYKVIGTKFNKSGDASGTFRIPDYNVTGRFLQPSQNAGGLIEAGLPNITGVTGADAINNSKGLGRGEPTGPFYYNGSANYNVAVSGGTYSVKVEMDLSRANSIYGNSTTVQPRSQLVHICIKYK